MLRIKYVQGKDIQTLENNVNAFLASLTSWDDGGETTTSGLCHQCGQRRRFNNKACRSFRDVREAR